MAIAAENKAGKRCLRWLRRIEPIDWKWSFKNQETASMKNYLLSIVCFALAPLAAHAQWIITDVHDFTTFGNIQQPSSLTQGSDGNVYGVMYEAGTNNNGSIYKLTLSWSGIVVTATYTTLHLFAGTDGRWPVGSMVEDNAGNFYGTASSGGANNHGAVFEYSSSGVFSVLYNFKGGTTDGCLPSGLTIQNSGSTVILYGAAGGCGSSASLGEIFRLTQSGGVWTETILHTFAGGTSDGGSPSGSMILASDGYLYGTTNSGGASTAGSVFRIGTSGGLTNIHYFSPSSGPNGNSVTQQTGASSLTLFGTSTYGGSSGYGAIYKLVEGTGGTFTYTIAHNFVGGTSDGKTPLGNLIYSPVLNYFLGTTGQGGASNGGTFYRITPAGTFVVVNSLTGGPRNGPIWGPGNNCSPCVVGTTTFGGSSSDGDVWVGIAP
jgi:uncharacterized repeat protein (TIGR03803 family)